jgi:arsenate reductase
MKASVLFVCIHNSARSQMAEAFLRQICGERFDAYSAGLEAGRLNPVVVLTMKQKGIDISGHQAKTVDDILKIGVAFQHVITVCDESNAERCPIFPGKGQRHHWSFPDPSALKGSDEEKLQQTAKVRDAIEERVRRWCGEMCGA